MDRIQKADLYRERGMNCAQAVLCAFGSDFNLDENTALRIATGFGSGMGRLCQVCGALTGGFMVAGLKHGKVIDDGTRYGTDSEMTYALVAELAKQFRERNGSILCRDLTGLDLSDPAQRQRGRDEGIFQDRCGRYIRDSVEILEQLLKD